MIDNAAPNCAEPETVSAGGNGHGGNGGNGNGHRTPAKRLRLDLPVCSPEQAITICGLLYAGKDVLSACRSIHIQPVEFWNLVDAHPSVARIYAAALKHRDRLREEEAVAGILRQARHDWRARSWYLEHVHSDRFSKHLNVHQDVTSVSIPVEVVKQWARVAEQDAEILATYTAGRAIIN